MPQLILAFILYTSAVLFIVGVLAGLHQLVAIVTLIMVFAGAGLLLVKMAGPLPPAGQR
jgi:hypothetical protein